MAFPGADWMSEQQARRKLESLVGTGVEDGLKRWHDVPRLHS